MYPILIAWYFVYYVTGFCILFILFGAMFRDQNPKPRLKFKHYHTMKTKFRLFPAAIILLAAVNIISCTKDPVTEEPLPVEKNGDGSSAQNPGTKPETKYEPFTVSLPDVSDTLAYKGHPVTVAFEVTATMPETVQVSVLSSQGGEASVSYDATQKTGKLTYTLSGDCAEVSVRFTDGTTTKDCLARATAYYLKIAKADDTIVSEEGEERFMELDTNLPEGAILIESPDWIATAIKDGRITVRFAPSEARDERTGIVSIRDAEAFLKPVTMEFRQEWALTNGEGTIQFKDKAFKTAMLEVADANRDGDVSFEEAETVQEIVIDGRGVKDLSGLDAFKNVWKLDARDNDIVDADILKELHFLYWLDLRGNKNLRTFDLTGCSMHFDHCEFELTDELQYKVVRRQVGAATYCKDINEGTFASVGSDPKCEHAVFIDDPEVTKDWSVQNTVHLLRSHTAGYGKTKVVFTGLGYTDRDIKDGTFGRIMTKAAELFQEEFAGTEFLANVDVLYMDRIIDCHDKWKMKMYDSSTFWMKNAYKEETSNTLSETYGAVTGVAPEDWMCANQNVLVVLVDIIPNLQNGSSVMSARASYKYCSYDNPNCQAARFVLTKDCYYNEGKDNEPYAYTWRIEDCYLNGCFESFVKSCNL